MHFGTAHASYAVRNLQHGPPLSNDIRAWAREDDIQGGVLEGAWGSEIYMYTYILVHVHVHACVPVCTSRAWYQYRVYNVQYTTYSPCYCIPVS